MAIDGPDTHQQVPEGISATVLFGNPTAGGVVVGPIPTTDFSDPWLINNAKTDESLGYPIGALAGVALAPNGTPVASPSPSPTPSDSPTDSPSDSPSQSPSLEPSPSSSDSPSPTPGLTPSPTPSASPSPTPTATPRPAFSMSTMSCPGGVVLSWSKYTGSGFARYVTLRNTNPTIRAVFPQPGTTVIDSASTLVQRYTAGVDGNVPSLSTYFYRTLVLDSGNRVLAASAVTDALGLAQASLAPVSVGTGVVSWGPYHKPACFTEYQVLYSTDPKLPLGVPSISVSPWDQTNTPIPSQWTQNQVVYFQVLVVRRAGSGTFVVGQTNVVSYTYP